MSGPDAGGAAQRGGATPKARLFWSAALLITVSDVLTKYWALQRLQWGEPVRVAGDVFRLRLNYNPGAAFGMHLGAHSRWIFLALALVILVVLGSMYRRSAPGERARALALGLVCGGAIGNVINRLWSSRGVVDFLDFGVGDARWPTFNVADIGVTTGAVLLAWVLWREDNAGKAPGNEKVREVSRGAAANRGEEPRNVPEPGSASHRRRIPPADRKGARNGRVRAWPSWSPSRGTVPPTTGRSTRRSLPGWRIRRSCRRPTSAG